MDTSQMSRVINLDPAEVRDDTITALHGLQSKSFQ